MTSLSDQRLGWVRPRYLGCCLAPDAAVQAASCWPCHDLRTNQKCTLDHWTRGRTPSPSHGAPPQSHRTEIIPALATSTTWPVSLKLHNPCCLWVYTLMVTSPHYNWVCSHDTPPLPWLARTRLNGPTVLAPTNRCYAQSEPGTAAPLLLHPALDLRTRLATAQPSNSRKYKHIIIFSFISTHDSFSTKLLIYTQSFLHLVFLAVCHLNRWVLGLDLFERNIGG